ncbi:hypothetical protein ACFVVM_08540 [Nocardia sp. NPDC058176]|uniref:hypothetical protein n=1 Tax=Nocardia sp. NPDC058176 TaxID=3346368 RepID=UPI0036DC7AED
MSTKSKHVVLEDDQSRTPLADAVAAVAHRTVNLHATPLTGRPIITQEGIRAVQDQLLGDRAPAADQSFGAHAIDSFHHPRGVLADAQALAAKAFGVAQTQFVTGGCTMANTSRSPRHCRAADVPSWTLARTNRCTSRWTTEPPR